MAIEWARVDKRAGISGFGAEYWGRGIGIASDRWSVGYTNRGGIKMLVTVYGNEYGGGQKYQRTWEISADDLAEFRVEPPGVAI